MWHPRTLLQKGGTGGNNSFTTERAGWQPEGGAAVYEMPPCPLRPPDAHFDPGAPQFTQAWWTVRPSSTLAHSLQRCRGQSVGGFVEAAEPVLLRVHAHPWFWPRRQSGLVSVPWPHAFCCTADSLHLGMSMGRTCARRAGMCWCGRASTTTTSWASSSWTQVRRCWHPLRPPEPTQEAAHVAGVALALPSEGCTCLSWVTAKPLAFLVAFRCRQACSQCGCKRCRVEGTEEDQSCPRVLGRASASQRGEACSLGWLGNGGVC